MINKVGQWLSAGRWFSPNTPVSSTNKTDVFSFKPIFLYYDYVHEELTFKEQHTIAP